MLLLFAKDEVMHRFFVEGFLPDNITVKKEDINHIKNVLRMKAGDGLTVVDEKGAVANAVIKDISDASIAIKVKEILDCQSEPPVRVILLQGIGKGDKMDFVVQKAVELGVADIVPVMMQRTVVRYTGDKADNRRERWRKIAIEAAKQSKRTALPVVHPVMAFDEALKSFPFDLGIMLWEDEQAKGLRGVIKEKDKAAVKTILLLVGPEGGIDAGEAETAQKMGFVSASLGKRILRTETAGIAALSVMMYEFGDFGDV